MGKGPTDQNMQGGRAETERERERVHRETERETENKELGFNPARLFCILNHDGFIKCDDLLII